MHNAGSWVLPLVASVVIGCHSERRPELVAAQAAASRLQEAVHLPGERMALEWNGTSIQSHGAATSDLTLPARARESFQLTDRASGVSIRVALHGALGAQAQLADGLVVYPSGHPGGDVLLRPTANGVEDYLWFEQKPAAEAATYDVTLQHGVAGLRLVANVLEFLDAGGAPRLRSAMPYLVDARGHRHPASLSVAGCAFDTGPRAPWGRSVTAPGAATCALHVSWENAAEIAYPAVLDPAWTTTQAMSVARFAHGAAKLQDGRVLVAGGSTSTYEDEVNASSEIFDLKTQTWAMTDNLRAPRLYFTMVPLADGTVLAAAGETTVSGNTNALSSAEIYDPSMGSWSNTGNTLQTARSRQAGVLLADRRVLVAGGYGTPFDMSTALNSAEIYDPATNHWTSAASMSTARTDVWHAGVLVGTKVLVGGGSNSNGRLNTAEVYDPAANTWTQTAGMLVQSMAHASAVSLKDGRVLLAGEYSSELYDPKEDQWVKSAGNMQEYRADFTLDLITGSLALAVGGDPTDTSSLTVETFDPSTGKWTISDSSSATTFSNLRYARNAPTTTVLGDGKIVVAGGATDKVELLNSPLMCNSSADCLSGFCVDSYCCDTACDGGCDRCDQPGSLGICQPVAAGAKGTEPSCAPYLCDGAHGTCPSSCTTDSDCASPNTCNNNVCGTELSNGKPCGSDGQCASGICSDGVCCDQRCMGACAACNSPDAPGQCVPVLQMVAGHEACSTDPLCGGFCDGNSPDCTYPAAGTSCGDAACMNNVATAASSCDGMGTCVEGTRTTCQNGCTGKTCSGPRHTTAGGCSCNSANPAELGLLLLAASLTLARRRRA